MKPCFDDIQTTAEGFRLGHRNDTPFPCMVNLNFDISHLYRSLVLNLLNLQVSREAESALAATIISDCRDCFCNVSQEVLLAQAGMMTRCSLRGLLGLKIIGGMTTVRTKRLREKYTCVDSCRIRLQAENREGSTMSLNWIRVSSCCSRAC